MTLGAVLPVLLLSTSCDRRADVGPVVVSVIGDKPELAASARRAGSE